MDLTLNNASMNVSDDNSGKKKPQSIIDMSNVDATCNESRKKENMPKNLETSFKQVNKSENENGFDLFSSDEDLDSLSSSESKRDSVLMP